MHDRGGQYDLLFRYKCKKEEAMIVSVHAYKNYLIIDGPWDLEHADWAPAGGDKIGCVLNDTAKNLGVSPEAIELLKTIPAGTDGIGEVMWFETESHGFAFGWLGPPSRLVDPSDAEGDRCFAVRDAYVEIPNDPPQGAVEAIDDDVEEESDNEPGAE
jgi:hypothetical protein